MERKGTFIGAVIDFGNWIYRFFMLQLLFIVYSLMGLVIGGIFPALASATNVMYEWMYLKKTDISVSQTFHSFYREYFWETNKLGWLLTAIGIILYIDIRVSSLYLRSIIIHSILILFIILFLAVFSYAFTVYARYNLRFFQYLKQSFLIALNSPIQTIAIFVGLVVVYYLFMAIPFTWLFFGVPIVLTPIVWFGSQGIQKVEIDKTKLKK